MLLECCRDGRLARCAQACEPDGKAALLAVCVAFAARQRRVPGDVTVGGLNVSVGFVGVGTFSGV